MAYRDQTKLQIYSNNILRTVIFGALLLIFWTVFSVASMQTAIMKRITDSDFAGYSYYSIVSTVNQVSQKTGDIEAAERQIAALRQEKENTLNDDESLQTEQRKVTSSRQSVFQELVIGAGPRLIPGRTRLSNRAEAGAIANTRLDFVLDRQQTPAQAEPSDGAPSPDPSAPGADTPTLARPCQKAQEVVGQYSNLGERIPGEIIEATVDTCLLFGRTAGLTDDTREKLIAAQRELEAAIDKNGDVKKERARIDAEISYQLGVIDKIETEIRNNTDLPAGTVARLPLEIFRLFPEVAYFIKPPFGLDFGLGDNLLMMQHELVLGLLTAIAGAVGGLSKFFLRRYTLGPDSSVPGEPEDQMPHRFIPTTLAGSFAGLSVFLILFGGLAVFQVGSTDTGATANYSSFAAFGFLAGMFSERVNKWLEKIAGRIFTSPQERKRMNAQRNLDAFIAAYTNGNQDEMKAIKQRIEDEQKQSEKEAAKRASAGED
ncbi:MAG: hypothetical protein AAGH57_04950 [Pseudomonadota bacterium]